MSDYWAKCAEARDLGDMRARREEKRMQERGITQEMKDDAGKEIFRLWEGFDECEPAEQLRRREKMMDCARIRGYLRDPDPGFDLIALNRMRREIEFLEIQLKVV